MMIKLKVFAAAKEIVAGEHVELELPTGSTIGDLKQALAMQVPDLANLIERSAFSIDQQYATAKDPVNAVNEVAMIPPVSGG